MKALNNLNCFFVGLPLFLSLIGLVSDAFLIYGLMSTIFTGLFQLVVGLAMLNDEPQDKKLQLYIFAVIIYFLVLFFTDLLDDGLFFYPQTIYAFYFTYILHTKKSKS